MTAPVTTLPRVAWYLPPGSTAPACLPSPQRAVQVSLRADAAPGAGLPPGGRLVGLADPPQATAGHWIATPAGWWLWLRGSESDPAALLRADAIDGLATPVGGAVLLVPRLLKPNGAVAVREFFRIAPDGTWGYAPAPEFGGLIDRLRAWQATPSGSEDERMVTALAFDLVAVNYHLCPVTIAALGWWDRNAAPLVISAACGIDVIAAARAAANPAEEHG